jgi:signal transduction histidine kinase
MSNEPATSLSQGILDHWPGIIFRQRPDLSFLQVSPRVGELTGIPAAEWKRTGPERPQLARVIHDLDAEEYSRQLQRVNQSADGCECSFRVRHAISGRVAYVTEFRRAVRGDDGKITGYVGYWNDTTRQTLSERRLATAAWKETLGLLTLGLSHDFNNVLAGTLALTDSYLAQVPNDHPFREGLQLIKQNTEQAAQLVRRIAQLHRGKVGNPGYQNLNEIVADSLDLLRKVIPKRIELVSAPAAEQLALYVDAVELQQVLINLALNAADAMPERGTLRVETQLHAALAPLECQVGTAPRAPAVCLVVADTGTGIKSRHLRFIFDPFFTTKPMNLGSGLGLYNARLFAEKHFGAISVDSREGEGTTFRVWLPQADFTEADRDMETFNRRRRSLLLAGRPDKLMERTAEFLRQHNFHVATGGLEAEELLRSSEYRFDGLMILAEPHERACLRLTTLVRQQKLPMKVIIKTIGCNQDELDTQFLLKADLIISADTPQDTIVEKLLATLDAAPPA